MTIKCSITSINDDNSTIIKLKLKKIVDQSSHHHGTCWKIVNQTIAIFNQNITVLSLVGFNHHCHPNKIQ